MKLISVTELQLPDIKVIRFGRFRDQRGYFTETYRKGDFFEDPRLDFLKGVEWVQCNESFSRPGVIRGLHFQWNPYMGKLVRTILGRMIDVVLDIRKGSPTLGKAIAHDMPADPDGEDCEWIWVPPGFAHGNVFAVPTTIEYFCTGQHSASCEAGISPIAEDIDWSPCRPELKAAFDRAACTTDLMTDKDRNALSLSAWLADARSENFIYGRC